jgi:hypothetical protein
MLILQRRFHWQLMIDAYRLILWWLSRHKTAFSLSHFYYHIYLNVVWLENGFEV